MAAGDSNDVGAAARPYRQDAERPHARSEGSLTRRLEPSRRLGRTHWLLRMFRLRSDVRMPLRRRPLLAADGFRCRSRRSGAPAPPPSREGDSQDAVRKALKTADDARPAEDLRPVADKGDARLDPGPEGLQGRPPPAPRRPAGHLRRAASTSPGKGDASSRCRRLHRPAGQGTRRPTDLRREASICPSAIMRLRRRTARRTVIADLISALSLLDPDPEARIAKHPRRRASKPRRASVLTDDEDGLRVHVALRGDVTTAMRPPPESDAAVLTAADRRARRRSRPTSPRELSSPVPPGGGAAAVTALAKLQSACRAPKPPGGTRPRRRVRRPAAASPGPDSTPRQSCSTNCRNTGRRSSGSLQKDPNGQFAPPLREALAEHRCRRWATARAQVGRAVARATSGTSPCRQHPAARPSTPPAVAAIPTSSKPSSPPRRNAPTRHQSQIALRPEHVRRPLAGQHPGAAGAGAVDHLRPDGRHQHGPRRVHDGRGVHHLRRQRVVQATTPPGALRLLPDRRRPRGVPRRRRSSGCSCEALVIRHLYGRPLETLLATWGIGLILIQAVRVHVRRQPLGHAAAAGWRAASRSCPIWSSRSTASTSSSSARSASSWSTSS